jgi:cell division protein FtsW
MIYSASYLYAKEEFGNSWLFFFKQSVFIVLGVFVCLGFSKTKFQFWYKNSFKLNLAVSFLLLLTFFPQFGLSLKGASRWLRFGGFNLQPGELAKYTTLLSSVYFFNNFKFWDRQQVLKALGVLLLPMSLLIFQPDFGMFALCMMNITLIAFLSSFPRKWFYRSLILVVLGMGGILITAPYRVKRLLSYLDPWNDPQNSGFQVIQSFLAFALGSFSGQGIGNSKEKLFYLPEAHNDFIFSVIGEELGFIGVFILVSLFISFTFFGLKIAIGFKNKTHSLFGVAAILSITFQAILNMGVVLGLLPTKGLNLPFISYGGSSLLANFFILGLFFSLIKKPKITFGEEDEVENFTPEFESRFYEKFRDT